MISVRRANERGRTETHWLDSRHTFAFGGYADPQHMGFRSLRVINDDRVSPGMGFGTHPHRDMEIVSYVLSGALAHRDSLGIGSVIQPNEVQKLSAGTGVLHSEFNHSDKLPVHFLQIWIIPERTGLPPSYSQIKVPAAEKRGQLRLIGANETTDNVIRIHQDMKLYASVLDSAEQQVSYELPTHRHAWIQVVEGAVVLNGLTLNAGDGAAVTRTPRLEIQGAPHGEFLLFDLA